MGSKGRRSRKPKRSLAKVPKYEEPNNIPLASQGGGAETGAGRLGHGSDHRQSGQPGRAGRLMLRMLGLRPKGGQPR
jgi:hypothetical protein